MNKAVLASPAEIVSGKALLARLEASREAPTDQNVVRLAKYAYSGAASNFDQIDIPSAREYVVHVFPVILPATRKIIIDAAFSHFEKQIEENRINAEIKAPDALVDLCQLVFAPPESYGLQKLYDTLNTRPRYCRSVYYLFRKELAQLGSKSESLIWTDSAKETLKGLARQALTEVYGTALQHLSEDLDYEGVRHVQRELLVDLGLSFLANTFFGRIEGEERYRLDSLHSNYARKLALLKFIDLAYKQELDLSPKQKSEPVSFYDWISATFSLRR